MSRRRNAELVSVEPRQVVAEAMRPLASLERLRELDADLRRLQRQAEKNGEPRTAILAIAQSIKLTEAVARLNGDELAVRAREVRETSAVVPQVDLRELLRVAVNTSPPVDGTNTEST
jgi:hypothetical protein